jgi:hypothetical protein
VARRTVKRSGCNGGIEGKEDRVVESLAGLGRGAGNEGTGGERREARRNRRWGTSRVGAWERRATEKDGVDQFLEGREEEEEWKHVPPL